NYPNPFNPSTTISFALPTTGNARIEVYNVLGALVAVPFDGVAQAGTHQVVWDGNDTRGQQVASGVYFYRLTAGGYTETKKMMLLK
ncbi:MAG: T9SS type A sorting domain-containing protein, partial [Candidatus Zixiibacteriota bacterium]